MGSCLGKDCELNVSRHKFALKGRGGRGWVRDLTFLCLISVADECHCVFAAAVPGANHATPRPSTGSAAATADCGAPPSPAPGGGACVPGPLPGPHHQLLTTEPQDCDEAGLTHPWHGGWPHLRPGSCSFPAASRPAPSQHSCHFAAGQQPRHCSSPFSYQSVAFCVCLFFFLSIGVLYGSM